jgi:hypothetical protein
LRDSVARRMTQRDVSDCEHTAWANDGTGLKCVLCGVLWPGHPLPKPEGRNAGYGALADQPGWNSRVRSMVAGLEDVE